MKKSICCFLITIMIFGFSESGFTVNPAKRITEAGLSKADEFYSAPAKRKKRRKSKGKKGKGGDMKAAIGAGLGMGLPMGDFGKTFKMGMGFDLEAEYFAAPTFSLGFNTGYLNFKYKSDTITSGKASITPMMVKGNIYLSDGPFKPYIGLGVGMFYAHSKITSAIPVIDTNLVTGLPEAYLLRTEFDDKETKPGIAPCFGFLLNMSNNLNLMFNAKYDMMFSKKTVGLPKSLSFLGINLGIALSF